MKVLGCLERSLELQLPPCGGDAGAVEASLIREGCTKYDLLITEDAQVPGRLTIAIPDPLPVGVKFPTEGVWTVFVETGCGCFQMPVFIECPAPTATAEHFKTPGNEGWQECCLPDNAATFKVTRLSPPTIVAEGYPVAQLLVNGTEYAVQLGVTAPSANYRWVDANAVVLATGSYAALGTTQYHSLDLTCATYALLPPEV